MIGAVATAFAACSDNEPKPNANVTLLAKTSSVSGSSASNGRIMNSLVITDFVVNIKEVEFDYAENKTLDSADKDVKLKGPFELDLINNQNLAEAVIGTGTLPNAAYKEVEFKLHKSDVKGSKMEGKSIFMEGTIGGVPFVFWHDTDEEFEINFAEAGKNLVVNGEDVKIAINFNLGSIFDAVSGVDLSDAEDGDNDGTIVIDPKNTDGNKDIADLIKKLLEEKTDLIDDKK